MKSNNKYLRDIDIDMIITSASFQKKLADNVQIIIINIGEKEYDKAVKKDGSKEEFHQNLKKIVLTTMLNKITDKVFLGSSAIIAGLLSAIGISNMEGNQTKLTEIDWESFNWENVNWENFDWERINFDLSHAEDEILGEGVSNFLSWVTDTASDWVDDSDFA